MTKREIVRVRDVMRDHFVLMDGISTVANGLGLISRSAMSPSTITSSVPLLPATSTWVCPVAASRIDKGWSWPSVT